MRERRPLRERFWAKVDKRETRDCWPWLASKDTRGYGHIGADGGRPLLRAHRVAYALVVGDIPLGYVVAHRCDNRACVNPAHLFAAPQRENVLDMIAKGRRHSSAGERNPRARLTAAAVAELRSSNESTASLASRFGVSRSTIQAARSGATWHRAS